MVPEGRRNRGKKGQERSTNLREHPCKLKNVGFLMVILQLSVSLWEMRVSVKWRGWSFACIWNPSKGEIMSLKCHLGVPLWCSRLKIQCCPCSGLGRCYGTGSTTCCRQGQIKGAFNISLFLLPMIFFPCKNRTDSLKEKKRGEGGIIIS